MLVNPRGENVANVRIDIWAHVFKCTLNLLVVILSQFQCAGFQARIAGIHSRCTQNCIQCGCEVIESCSDELQERLRVLLGARLLQDKTIYGVWNARIRDGIDDVTNLVEDCISTSPEEPTP